MNVSGLKDIDSDAEGYSNRLYGEENVPKAGSCCETGIPSLGSGLSDTIKVTIEDTDPVLSVAVREKLNGPILLLSGEPDMVRLVLSKYNHDGLLDMKYCILGSGDEKVEAENVN